VNINCSSSGQDLSVRFSGNAKGSFTGSNHHKVGLLEETTRARCCSTRYRMPSDLQAKLPALLRAGW